MRSLFIAALLSITIALFVTPTLAQTTNNASTLQTILKQTYNNNPSLMAAREELKETMELYPQAKAGWRPSINAEANLFSTHLSNSNFSGADGAVTKDVTLSVDQPLWRGGKTFAETAKASELIKAGEALLLQKEQRLFLDAARAYVTLIRDAELLTLRTQNEIILNQELTAAKERMEIGDITRTDVEQAKARVSRAASRRIQAEANLSLSKANLEALTGAPAPISLTRPNINFTLPQNVNDMIAMAEEKNPELIVAQFQKTASEHNQDATLRELFPQIHAFASLNRQYDPQPGIIDRSSAETIGLRASIALYEGGVIRSRERENQHAIKRQEFEIEDIRRQIKKSIVSNLQNYAAAIARTQNRQDEIAAASAALEGVREESRMGQRSLLNVLDADEELIDARSALAGAQRDEYIAQYALASSLGLLNAHALKITAP